MAKKKLRREVYELMIEGKACKIRGFRKVIDDKYLLIRDGRIYDRELDVIVPSKFDKRGDERVILTNHNEKKRESSITIKALRRHVGKGH